MRIVVDARLMGPQNTRGIGRYTEELVRALIPLLEADQLVLLMRDPECSPFLGLSGVEHCQADIPWYSWREQLVMPRLFAKARPNLVYVPHWNTPLLYRGPLVVTIHDLILRHTHWSSKISTRHPLYARLKFLAYQATLRRVIRRAGAIMTPTQWVAQDVEKYYPQAKGKVTCTGFGLTAWPEKDPGPATEKPYLLYVGSVYPHKRFDLVLDSWPELAARFPEYELRVVCEKDLFLQRFEQQAQEQKIPRIHFLGKVSDEMLQELYRHAACLVFSSSDEGIGLPPLEALANGCPVVSSDAACLPEVLPRQGVFFFRSGERDGMIKEIATVLGDVFAARQAADQVRSELLQRYSWPQVAKRTINIFHRVGRDFHAQSKTLL